MKYRALGAFTMRRTSLAVTIAIATLLGTGAQTAVALDTVSASAVHEKPSATPPHVFGAGAAARAANGIPNTPKGPEVGPPFTQTSGVWQTNTETPTLRNTVIDPDGDTATSTFEVWTADAAWKPVSKVKLSDTNEYGVLVSGYVASGKPTSVDVPKGKLKNGVSYLVRSSAYDGKAYESDWSPWSKFKVAVPVVEKPAKPTSVANNGKPGEFTVNLPAGHKAKWVEWQLDGAAWKQVDAVGKTSVTFDTGLRSADAALRSAAARASHTLNVRTANDGGASDAVSVAFSGNGTNTGGDYSVDLKLPDPDTNSPNPDQSAQVPTGLITQPLGAPVSNSPTARKAPLKEQCGPVGKNGAQACFGPSLAFDELPPKVQQKLKAQQKQAKRKAARAPGLRAANGMTDWCATNPSGQSRAAFATRTVECESKTLPAYYKMDGKPYATAYFSMTREISLDGTTTWTQRVNIKPVLISPLFRAIEMVMKDQFCTGHTQCKDPGKAPYEDWDGKPLWTSAADTHEANLKTTFTWDDTEKERTFDFRTDFRIAGILQAGNTPGLQDVGYQWGMDDPSDLEMIRCDTKKTFGKSGCIFVNVAPTYTFNAAKFPQAAAHAWLLQQKLPNTMGVKTRNTPLYYLPGGRNGKNRAVVCDEDGWANKYGDLGAMQDATDKPNCDEFAFNASYNSAGQPKSEDGLNPVASGSECVQTFAKKQADGVHLLNIDGMKPTWKEVCGRSAISGKHNSGSMSAFSAGFAKKLRLDDRDPYWLETGMSGDCEDKNGVFKCTMKTS